MDDASDRARRSSRPPDPAQPRRPDAGRPPRRPSGGPVDQPTGPVLPWARPAARDSDGDPDPTTRLPTTPRRGGPGRDTPDRAAPRPPGDPRGRSTPAVDDAVTTRQPLTPAAPDDRRPQGPRAPTRRPPDRKPPDRKPPDRKPEDKPSPGAPASSPVPPAAARTGPRRPRTLRRALLATAAATAAPGSGHLMLHRRRTGGLILGTFVVTVVALLLLGLTLRRSDLLATLTSTRVLVLGAAGCVLGAAAWIAVVIRTWVVAQPRGLDSRRRATGIACVTALCLLVAAPLGFAANLANSQRALLDQLFSGGGGTSAAEAIGKPRLNLLLVGSDAGPDRTGTRTDTMMVASVDTATGRTTLFSLPRNIAYAQFPPGSEMAEEFPDGFHSDTEPNSGDFLLNGVYAYGNRFPDLAPPGPTSDPGLNLLHQTVGYMLGLHLDYYIEVNMEGFASIIDALGGLRVDVGPEPIPVGGITPSGRQVEPDRYIEPGVQQLDGEDALAFARSRTNSTDYVRMGRQRCMIQSILNQTSPTELVANFQSVASATTANVATNIPRQVLPALLSIADEPLALESVAFDPNLPDPDEPDGRFDTGDPDFSYMRQVVRETLARDSTAPSSAAASPSDAPETTGSPTDDGADSSTTGSGSADSDSADSDSTDSDSAESSGSTAQDATEAPLTTTPVSLAQSC